MPALGGHRLYLRLEPLDPGLQFVHGVLAQATCVARQGKPRVSSRRKNIRGHRVVPLGADTPWRSKKLVSSWRARRRSRLAPSRARTRSSSAGSHLVAGPGGGERRRHHYASHPQAGHQPVHPVDAAPRNRSTTRPAVQSPDQLAHRLGRVWHAPHVLGRRRAPLGHGY